MLLVDEKHKLTTENTSCTQKQNSTLHAALEYKYIFMMLVNTKKIVSLRINFV